MKQSVNKKAIANMIDGNIHISDIRDLRAQRMSAVFVNDRANTVNRETSKNHTIVVNHI